MEARAGSGAAVQGSSSPGASPGADRLLQRAGGEARLLAAPFSDQKEFPLPVLFCLAQVEERAGRRWLVWRFDRAGNPVVPAHSRNGTGHTRG